MAMSLWLGFLGFQENNSLRMFFVVVVVAGGCRGDLGFGFLFLFGFWDILFYCVDIILMCCIVLSPLCRSPSSHF